MSNNTMVFFCKICNKNYKSKKSLYVHNRRYHTNTLEISSKSNPNIIQISSKSNPNIIHINSNSDGYKCRFCNNRYKFIQGRWKHEKICKIRKEKDNNNNYKNKLKLKDAEIKKLKERLRDKMNKNCKIHYKTLQKINNQLNNNITKNNCVETINNIHNRNIINFNLVGFGKEELSDVLSNKEQLKILKKRFKSLPFMIDYVHFNKDYPQYQNFIITSIKNNIAYKYDEEKKQFIAGNKEKLLNELIDNRMFDIDTFYKTHIDKLNDKCKEVINRFLDKYDNNKLDSLNNDINLVVYNNMNKVIDKYKVSVKQNLDKILTYDDLIQEKNNMENKFNMIIKSIKEENKSLKDDFEYKNKLLKEDYNLLKNELENKNKILMDELEKLKKG
jgi:hypothetical protein